MPKAKETTTKEKTVKETVYSKPPKKTVKDSPLTLPSISLLNQDGTLVNVFDITSAVIFMYPKANTPGCTKQACGFRDSFDKIKEAGYEIYGLSADSPKSQLNWKTKYDLQYNFLCDPEYKLVKHFGAFKAPKGIKRSVVIVDKGVVVMKEIQISPMDSVSRVLEFIGTDSKE